MSCCNIWPSVHLFHHVIFSHISPETNGFVFYLLCWSEYIISCVVWIKVENANVLLYFHMAVAGKYLFLTPEEGVYWICTKLVARPISTWWNMCICTHIGTTIILAKPDLLQRKDFWLENHTITGRRNELCVTDPSFSAYNCIGVWSCLSE